MTGPKVYLLKREQDIEYFVRRMMGGFITNEQNRMLDVEMAFLHGSPNLRWPDRWVPVMQSYRTCNGNMAAMSRELGITRFAVNKLLRQVKAAQEGRIFQDTKYGTSRRSWDNDPRVASMTVFQRLVGRAVFASQIAKEAAAFKMVRKICVEARNAQVSNQLHSFVIPDHNAKLEEQCARETAILRDPIDGSTLLDAEDALFVTFKSQLSEYQATLKDRFRHIRTNDFSLWLNGNYRDLGTLKVSDSIFSRFDIRDPRSGELARFTHHDLRHWLATSFHNGGLTEQQIATFFNKNSVTSNSTYNQTSMKDRARRLREVVGEGMVLGHVVTAHARLAKENAAEAAEYLAAATKYYSPMPHGICLMNMASEPCPHALSCFSCGGGTDTEPSVCENLVVDPKDPKQIQEIEAINRNARNLKKFFENEGETNAPQFVHHHFVERTTSKILEEVRRNEKESS